MASAALMPWPSSPTSQPSAPRYSISLEAFDLLPHLSLSRWISRRLREPSGSQPGSRKQERPRSVWASVTKTSLCGHREEPFVAVDQIGLARPASRAGRTGGGLRRAQVRAAPASRSASCRRCRRSWRCIGAGRRIVARREDERLPDRAPARAAGAAPAPPNRSCRADSRCRSRPGSRGRTACRARRARPAARAVHDERVRAVADRQRHQLVPGRMELDLVDAVAEAVVAAEHRAGCDWRRAPAWRRARSRPSRRLRSAGPAPSRSSRGRRSRSAAGRR